MYLVAILLVFQLTCGYSNGTDRQPLFSDSKSPSLSFQDQQPSQARPLVGNDVEDTPGRPDNPSLRKVVPAGYDKYVLPKNLNGGPLPVYISAKVRDIQKIDETNMDLTIEWFIRLYWRDTGLIWPTHLPNDTWLNISPDIVNFVWLPTTYIDHVKRIHKPSLLISPESFRMQNNGLIRYSMSVTTTVSCSMDFSAYPFDTQVCYILMESYQFTSAQVTYEWFDPKIGRSKKIRLGQFDFDFYSVQQQNTTHQGRKFPTVMVEILLKRRVSYHLMNTFLPSGLFVMVSWLTFLVPVHMVPGRMVLTITTLLTMVSMFASVRQESPKVSYAKAVDQWMIMCIIFVFMVLFEFTIAIYLYEKACKAKDGNLKKHSKGSNAKVSPSTMTSPVYTNLVQRTTSENSVRSSASPNGSRQQNPQETTAPVSKQVWKVGWWFQDPKEEEVDLHKYWMTWCQRVEGWSPLVFFMAFLLWNLGYWAFWIKNRNIVEKSY